MSEEQNVDTQVEEQNLNTDTDIDDSQEVDEPQTKVDEPTDENSNEDSNEPSEEELDALSDDEFVEYMNSGKMPVKAKEEPKQEKPTEEKAKIVSKPEKKASKEEPESKASEPTNINYEEVYKQIFSPFRANGKEITPRNVEDVISLMQMGANYTKKMQAMAPMRKIFESINAANISEDDLTFLIDLHKGNKEAIKQLLKKNEIDTLDLDLDEINYTPNKQNIVSDGDVNFSETLSEINDSLPQIQDILNNKWDVESKKFLLNDPKMMVALHEEIQMGRFEKVQERLELEKTFGRYKGVPDVQAYIDLVNRMVQEEQSKQPKKTESNTPKPNKNVPDKRKAAPTRGTNKSSSTLTAKDLFSMSDEEFERLSIKDIV